MASVIQAFDTETERFAPGNMAPKLVCISGQKPGGQPMLWHHTECRDLLRSWFVSEPIFVGHNVAYDMVVICSNYPDLLPKVFQAYEEDRVTDTMWRSKLLDIAAGCYRGRTHSDGRFQPYQYDLASLAKRVAGITLVKDDTRTSYGPLRDVPLDQWPERARTYPLEDASATLAVYLSQEVHKAYLDDQYRQARAYFALQLMSVWGIRTRQEDVDALRSATLGELDKVKQLLVDNGLVRPDGTRDTKVAMARMEKVWADKGGVCARTKGGKPSLAGETCEASEDPLLEAYGEYTTLNKVLSTDVPQMEAGIREPIHCHYDLAATGRTTCAKPNLQNLRRLPGIREAYRPREGMVFIDADYGSLELWSFAQIQLYLFGHSALATVLNSGRDPHTAFGADILGISYEEAAKRKKDHSDHEFANARQTGKACNFGYPGGLGAEKMTWFAKKAYGISFTIERAMELKDAWFKRWPEAREYFQYINTRMGPDNYANVTIPVANFHRAGATFTAAANTMFQGLAAACAKKACWMVAKACYLDKTSPLYGSRPVVFVHDQLIIETPDDSGAHDAAMETRRLMRQACEEFMPQCIPEVEPILTRYWSKDANECRDSRGRLVPWPQ